MAVFLEYSFNDIEVSFKECVQKTLLTGFSRMVMIVIYAPTIINNLLMFIIPYALTI